MMSMLVLGTAIAVALFVAYNLFHYILFLLVTNPKDASKIGHELNEFERRQLAEWIPRADICRRRCAKFGGRVRVIVTDFDTLDLPSEGFDAIYALESIGYTKDLDALLARCWRMLKPGGRLMIRSPGSLDHCRREEDYRSVTAFFDNWRYNFLGANLLVYKARRLGFNPIRYRRLPFWAWGLTWNFIQHMLLWRYRLKMRTFVELEWIIWRTSKGFVFGNAYNTVLATKPAIASRVLERPAGRQRASVAGMPAMEQQVSHRGRPRGASARRAPNR